ncbi:MAG: HPr(Ser) kinase/phosphatase [Gemmatimonadota bacterium]|nr:HPr(Ser) kinase/phosphatase [Gemmatimonadota bacterium]
MSNDSAESALGLIPEITVQRLFDERHETLHLEVLNPDIDLDRPVSNPDLSSPGIALMGYTERFASDRIQVFGETEIAYLRGLTSEERRERVKGVFSFGIPVVFVTKGLELPDGLLEVAAECSIPVLRSDLSTKDFYRHIKPYLDAVLAPRTNVHGSLADVYGVGLLFVGDSGVGKSECVLDLVERGHRLVADDHIIVSRRGPDILLGQGHQLQAHHMEIRGLGIIDIRALFGIHATRQQKRVEVMVRLQRWDEDTAYTRTGLDTTEVDLLGIKIPEVTIPLNAGKNITVISEVVAMNHLLKYAGIDSAAAYNQKLQDAMSPVHEYFEQDYE